MAGEDSLKELRAEFPDSEPAHLEEGCPFRNRCPLYLKNRIGECETVPPVLKPTLGGGRVACHQARDQETF